MSVIEIAALSLGLTLDVFSVSVGVGLTMPDATVRQRVRLGWHFAVFHFLMPVAGWLAGMRVSQLMSHLDHWVAFVLLSFVGGRMIWEERGEQTSEVFKNDPTRGLMMVVLCVATSVDAFAVGLSLALLRVHIWLISFLLGLVAGLMTLLGFQAGAKVGNRFRRYAHWIGGLAIIGVGVKILVEHLVSL